MGRRHPADPTGRRCRMAHWHPSADRRRTVWWAGFVMAGVLVLPACDSDGGSNRDGDISTLTVTVSHRDGARRPGFEVPETVPAGPTRIDLVNHTGELHQAQLLKLNDGVTVEMFKLTVLGQLFGENIAEVLEDPTHQLTLRADHLDLMLTLAAPTGATGAVEPGRSSSGTLLVDLAPGRYVLVDILPDADGLPYLANGLIEAFEVTPSGRPTSGPGAQLDLASPTEGRSQ
jgi:hypothetical protein